MSTSWPGGIISKTAVVPTGPLETGTASGMWTLDQAAAYTKQGIWPLAGNAGVIDQLFSAYTYTGNGATQTITNGIDLAGKGGLVWAKNRTDAWSNMLSDTVMGQTKYRFSDTTDADRSAADIMSFGSSGFTLPWAYAYQNNSPCEYISWSFAQGNKFFKMAQVTVSGSNQTVDLSSLGTVGMVTVKRTDSTSAWYTWHRSLTAGNLVYLNTTAAQAASAAISVSGTTLTLAQATIGNGTYIVYAWAHDTDTTTGMIQCGTFTGSTTTVTLGWEPQFLLYKRVDGGSLWQLFDTARGLGADAAGSAPSKYLGPSTSATEAVAYEPGVTSTGFTISSIGVATYIYMAIRRPMKVPTLGTQVYNAIARTGTGAAARVTGVGFAPDLVMGLSRGTGYGGYFYDRLRGVYSDLRPFTTDAERANSSTDTLSSFDMLGYSVGADAGALGVNASGVTYVAECFKRAPKVFDQVCYTGSGTAPAVTHNLGVAPELVIEKNRSGLTNWFVNVGGTAYLVLNTTAAQTSFIAALTATTFQPLSQVGGATYVAYLFATLAGVSKVGSYTGNGSSLTINAGFTTGARFILIKRTDSTGDWYTWDSTRGIVAGNDPHLSLNTIAAEVTTDDSIDPDNSGFIVNQVAATNINVTSATYIYLALA